ncbi:MAG: flagellar basal body-associated FliL family protein [Rhodobacteraceae bacterium]|nr:flagellar basal body-associated FliL family protein [Paracoccaceae bacterium]
MGKLIPIILMLIGAGAGVGAGIMLRPAAEPEMAAADAADYGGKAEDEPDNGYPESDNNEDTGYDSADAEYDTQDEYSGDKGKGGVPAIEYIALRRQMIVPLVDGDRVGALMILSLSIEATGGSIELIYEREPKLRDEFLQVLFRHANTGGFDGMFTSGEAMSDLKSALNAAASDVLGSVSHQVLITEILRQEI